MEQQRTTTNVAAGGPTQPEANTGQQPQLQTETSANAAKISFFNPEILCVGLVGLFHNFSVLGFVLFFLIYWSVQLNYVIKEDKKHPDKEHEIGGLSNVTVFQVVCYVVLHVVATLFSVGCLIMDVLLRGCTDPVNLFQYYHLFHFTIFPISLIRTLVFRKEITSKFLKHCRAT